MNLPTRALCFARRTLIAARVCVLEARARRLDSAARLARRYSRNTFLAPGSDREMRLAALSAWQDAGRFEHQAEETRNQIRELIHATA